MKPGKHNIEIQQGCAFTLPMTFTSSVTGAAIDLTGRSPFVAQVRDDRNSPLLLDLTVTDTDLANGVITLSATAADTAYLPIRDTRWDIIDATDLMWVRGTATITDKISDNS